MPLIAHITELDGRLCQTCRHWLAYNQADEVAPRGECLLYAIDGAPVKLESAGEGSALLVPFDWSCKGWEEKPRPESPPDGSRVWNQKLF
jgi:hypothetical protein